MKKKLIACPDCHSFFEHVSSLNKHCAKTGCHGSKAYSSLELIQEYATILTRFK